MATLRKQKKMVKALRDFYKNTSYSDPATYQTRINNIADNALPEKDFSSYLWNHLTLKDRLLSWLRPQYFASPNYQLNRAQSNDTLYSTCLRDGFIEPVIEEVFDESNNTYIKVSKGIRLTTKGTDLLHPLGFSEIFLQKYPLTWHTVLKIFLGLTTGGAGAYVLTELAKHFVFGLPY